MRERKQLIIDGVLKEVHVCAFSGGATSSYMSKIVKDKIAPDPILLFHNTFTEDVDTYRFKDAVASYLGLDITEDSDGRDIWQVFDDEGYLGNGRNTMCSRILKQERSMKYLQSLLGQGFAPVLYVGFTSDEWKRAQRVTARYLAKNIHVRFPLIEAGISKEQCHKEIETCWNIELPRMYKHYNHANCMPCIKGKKAYWGLVYKYNNRAWIEASNAEEKFQSTIFTEAGSLSEELKNCKRLADVYEKKDLKNREALLDAPCECIT